MKRVQIARQEMSRNITRIPKDEVAKANAGKSVFSDSIISLKAYCKTGGNVAILDAENNKDAVLGVVDFENGKILGIDGKGSLVVEAMKVGFAAGISTDDSFGKSFSQSTFPADFEHGYLEIIQEGVILKKVKLSQFVMAGDEAQTVNGGRVLFGTPFTLAGDTKTEVRLRRPKGIAGTEGHISIDFVGMQAVNSAI